MMKIPLRVDLDLDLALDHEVVAGIEIDKIPITVTKHQIPPIHLDPFEEGEDQHETEETQQTQPTEPPTPTQPIHQIGIGIGIGIEIEIEDEAMCLSSI